MKTTMDVAKCDLCNVYTMGDNSCQCGKLPKKINSSPDFLSQGFFIT